MVLCDYLVLRATWPRSAATVAGLARTVRVADALAAARCEPHATDARLLAARTALELGQRDVATAELAKCQASRRYGSVELRSRAWHATALLRLSAGDRRGAESAVHAGLSAVERHQTTLAATELRAHASAHGTELAALGLELALADGRAERILTWSERWGPAPFTCARAGSPRIRCSPSSSTACARSTGRSTRCWSAAATPAAWCATGFGQLEHAIRQRARVTAVAAPTAPPRSRRRSCAGSSPGGTGPVRRVQGHAVGGRADPAPLPVVHIGDAAPVRREIQLLRFGLRRLAMSHGPRALSIRSARLGPPGRRRSCPSC